MNTVLAHYMVSGTVGRIAALGLGLALCAALQPHRAIADEGFKADFKNPEAINPALTIDGKWKKGGGLLTSDAGTEMAQIYIKDVDAGDVTIAFAARVVRGTEKNTHFGVYFDVEGDRIIQPYTFLNRFNILETELGKDVQHVTIANYSKMIPVGEQSPFILFTIRVAQGEGEVLRDGEVIGHFVSRPGVINRVRLYTWGGDIAIREVEFKKLSAPAKSK